MPDTLADLRALVADVRAALEDESLRGVVAEFADETPPAAVAVAAPEPPSRSTRPAVGSSWAKLADRAREKAEATTVDGAAGLQLVRDELGDCRRCNLCTNRSQIVFGVGDPTADLVLVGGAPGYQDDRRGEPFVGPPGEMLDKMLLNVLGLDRSEVHILNVVKCKPLEDRLPHADEVAACMPFLHRQLAAIQPKVILVVGTVALRALLGVTDEIVRYRGQWASIGSVPALTTFHPAYLLEHPDGKRHAFADLKALGKRYDELGGRRSRPSPF